MSRSTVQARHQQAAWSQNSIIKKSYEWREPAYSATLSPPGRVINAMPNFYRDNDDLRFYTEKWIDWAALQELTERFGDAHQAIPTLDDNVQFYHDVLDLVGQFVADEVAPHSAQIDKEGVQFVDGEPVFPTRLASIFDAIKALELYGMNLPRELGGQNCPMMLYMIQTELFTRADTSVTTHFSFHGGIAMALLFSIQEGTTTFDDENGLIIQTRFAEAIEEIRAATPGVLWTSPSLTQAATWRRCAVLVNKTRMANGLSPDKRSLSPLGMANIIL